MTSRALVVRGGWEGHDPTGTTDSFVPFLERSGFEVVGTMREVGRKHDRWIDVTWLQKVLG